MTKSVISFFLKNNKRMIIFRNDVCFGQYIKPCFIIAAYYR